MTEERKYPDINNLYKEAYDTAYMEASLRAAKPQQPVAWLIDIDGVPKFIDPDTKRISFKDWVAKPLFFATTPPQRTWVGLTDKEWHDIWEEFALQHEDERHRRHEEFQNEMVAKHGAGHYYMDEDEDWNIQKDMIQKLVEDKLKEKNS